MAAARPTGGFKALRFAGIVALSGLGVAAFLIVGSYFFWQAEKKSGVVSQRSLQDLRVRLETIKRERDDIQASEETYKTLIARGAFVPERRLDLIDALEQLRKRHDLVGLEYEVSPQRQLKLADGTSFGAVSILASRIRLKILAYHDGELIGFLDEFPRINRGFFPLDRCTVARSAEYEMAAQGRVPVASLEEDETPAGASAATPASAPGQPAAHAIVAECTLEWITLVDKRKTDLPQAGAPTSVQKPI